MAASTQNQALSALVFLYKIVLQMPLDEDQLSTVRTNKPKRLLTVFSKGEALAREYLNADKELA